MKSLAVLLIIFGLILPVYASDVILYEDFEGAVSGTLLEGYNGWTGYVTFEISDTVIDQGQSVDCGSAVPSYPKASKAFSNTLGTGEYLEISGTLYAPGDTKDYAQLSLRKQADSGEDAVQFMLGYGELIFAYEDWGMSNYEDIRVPNTGTPIDVKALVSDGLTDFYYRENGQTEWTQAGSINSGVPSLYEYVQLQGHSGYIGNVDTIGLIKTDGTPAAETTLLSEEFEGSAPGTLLNGYNGWSADGVFEISSDTIDQNQSVDCGATAVNFPSATKSFSNTLETGEYYILSATLSAPASSNDYAELSIRADAESAEGSITMMLGYGDLICAYDADGEPNYQDVRVSQSSEPMDVQAVITDGHTDFYYRLEGETEWTAVGSLDVGNPYTYEHIVIKGHTNYAGNIDTISLTAEPAPFRLPGDANNDGIVNAADAQALADNWLTLTDATWDMGDFNGDYAVNDLDATILAANWQTGAANAAVPEPGAMVLLCLGGLMLLLPLRKRSV